jgi:proton-translocating NADH-quinone oxidoreductase chain L
MLILIVFLPLFGFFSGICFGRFINACFTTTFFLFLCLSFSFFLAYDLFLNGIQHSVNLGTWVASNNLNVSWSFLFDNLTVVMLCVVTLISTLVHLYSIEYMSHDPHQSRFMAYLSLFTFFMLILITANNFLQMFVGWEGVGLCSYLLINFWFTRIQANKAAIKAMLVNRIGDFALLIALFSIATIFESLDYDIVFSNASQFVNYKLIIKSYEISIIDLICILLFIGAMGKSAQLGLHIWLPDAMEGPTPVSALIHAATMVTAGIFLITRSSYLFEYSPITLNFILIIGASTAFFGATTGLFQNDLKKVIAYSTCSQLGYMAFSCGLSSYDVAMFHLSNHAIFKALLFLAAGSIIHSMGDEQDMRKMGGLRTLLPFAYTAIVIGSLALTGFPFLAGFYSKDIILEVAYAKGTLFGDFAYILGVLSAFCTAFYSTRLLYLVFLSNSNGNKKIFVQVHEPSWKMTFPLFLLSTLSLIVGYSTKDIFIGFGTDFWGSSIFILPQSYDLIDIEFSSLFFKLLPLIVSLFGIVSAFFIYNTSLSSFFILKQNKSFNLFYTFLNKKWFFDKLYASFVTQNFIKFSYFFSYQKVDRGILEQFGPVGIVRFFNSVVNELILLHTNSIYQILFLIFLSVLITFSFLI